MAMIKDMKLTTGSSVAAEADVDRQLTGLLEKLATGDATDSDRRLIRELSMRRVRMMRPPLVTNLSNARRLSVCG